MPDSVSPAATLDENVERLQQQPTLLNGERLFSPASLAKALNVPGHRGGAHLNSSTIFRHITKGCRTKTGELVRLEAVRVGDRWLSSVEAFARFSARLTAAALPTDAPPVPPAPTPAARNRAAKAASAEAAAIFGAKKDK